MTDMTLTFTPDGMGRSLYTEVIDLGLIGQLSISRATNIEFDNEKGVWRVYEMAGFPMFTAPARSQCLDWERLYLQAQEDLKHDA
jgi:hypothetical protein